MGAEQAGGEGTLGRAHSRVRKAGGVRGPSQRPWDGVERKRTEDSSRTGGSHLSQLNALLEARAGPLSSIKENQSFEKQISVCKKPMRKASVAQEAFKPGPGYLV